MRAALENYGAIFASDTKIVNYVSYHKLLTNNYMFADRLGGSAVYGVRQLGSPNKTENFTIVVKISFAKAKRQINTVVVGN